MGRVYSEVALFTPAIMDSDSWFRRRPLQPVYADTASFVEVSSAAARKAFFESLAKCRAKERLMYASDFYMSGIYEGYETYAHKWIAAFQAQYPDDWQPLVGGNAAEFLGLRAGKQRDRLDQFIELNGLSPRWRVLL